MIKLLQITNQDFLKVYEDGVLSSASWLNNVLFIGAGLLLTINLYRYFKKESIEVSKLELPLNRIWIIVLGYTLAHLYCSIILVKSTKDFLLEAQKLYNNDTAQISKEKKILWAKITLSGDFSFRRMQQRQQTGQIHIPFSQRTIKFYKISVWDISNWIYFGLAMLIVNGIPDFKEKDKKRFRSGLLIALFLALANWLIGSVWTAQLSNLLM